MKVIIHEKVLKKMGRFPKYVREDVYETISILKNFPFIRLDIKKLGGNIYRVRRGKMNIRGRISYG